MKIQATSIIRGIQYKSTVRYHIWILECKIKKTSYTNTGANGDQQELSHCAERNRKWYNHWKAVRQFVQKLNVQALYVTTIYTFRYFPKKNVNLYSYQDLYMNIHNHFICNSSKLKTNLNVYQKVEEWKGCGVSTQWNTDQH